MAHQLDPYHDNPFLELGRFLQEQSYIREKKSLRLENIEIDLIKRRDGDVVVGEIKKSSRFQKSATMQLAFYLQLLEEYGLHLRGELLFPKEKKRIAVELTDNIKSELRYASEEIKKICSTETPPAERWIPYCKNCAYREFCWV